MWTRRLKIQADFKKEYQKVQQPLSLFGFFSGRGPWHPTSSPSGQCVLDMCVGWPLRCLACPLPRVRGRSWVQILALLTLCSRSVVAQVLLTPIPSWVCPWLRYTPRGPMLGCLQGIGNLEKILLPRWSAGHCGGPSSPPARGWRFA